MADFNLRIDTEKFERVGFYPTFNEDKFGDLLDFVAGDAAASKPPTVYLAPWVIYLHRPGSLKRYAQLLRRQTYIGGQYRAKDSAIQVFIGPEALGDENTILLHETQHWADDTLGIPFRCRKEALNRALNVGCGVLAIEAAIEGGAKALQPVSPVASELVLFGGSIVNAGICVAGMWRQLYHASEGEIRAREFEARPDVVSMYGDIITVHEQ